MMFVYKILRLHVSYFSTFESPTFIIKNMVEKGALCFVTSKALIQKRIKLYPSYKMKLGQPGWSLNT
jgi:hypothetical protein